MEYYLRVNKDEEIERLKKEGKLLYAVIEYERDFEDNTRTYSIVKFCSLEEARKLAYSEEGLGIEFFKKVTV